MEVKVLIALLLVACGVILLQRVELKKMQRKLKDTYELKEAAAAAVNMLAAGNLGASAEIKMLQRAYKGSEAARKKLYAEVRANENNT